jgi:hypothetical protein
MTAELVGRWAIFCKPRRGQEDGLAYQAVDVHDHDYTEEHRILRHRFAVADRGRVPAPRNHEHWPANGPMAVFGHREGLAMPVVEGLVWQLRKKFEVRIMPRGRSAPRQPALAWSSHSNN